jgi:hypothetical protein
MKSVILQLILTVGCAAFAHANSLLKNPVTGALNNSAIGDLCIAANGSDVVLLAADMSSVYAIDIADNNPSDAVSNTITNIPSFVTTRLNPVAGTSVFVLDMVVNPISKSLYLLADGGSGTYIFKVTNQGNTVTLLDLKNITYSKMAWGGNLFVNEMAWGNNTLYVTSGDFNLDASIGWIAAPFEHSTSFTTKSTSMFKSNWGGQYFTEAPLETMDYGFINGHHRLMGVTTCAPGFSIDAEKMERRDVVEVTEDFNINTGVSEKVVFQKHDGKNWLFDLHDNYLYRIGEKYLDGSQVNAGKINNNAEVLRNSPPAPSDNLTEDEIKQYSGTYRMMAYWDDYRLLLLGNGSQGVLKMFQTAVNAPALSIGNPGRVYNTFEVYPNPAAGSISLLLPNSFTSGTAHIYAANGKVLVSEEINPGQSELDINSLSAGNYFIDLISADGRISTTQFIVK